MKLSLLFVLLLNRELRLRFLRALLDYLEFPLFDLWLDNFLFVEHDSEEVFLLQNLLGAIYQVLEDLAEERDKLYFEELAEICEMAAGIGSGNVLRDITKVKE